MKFLVDREGRPVRRYTSPFDPIKMEDDVSSHFSFLQNDIRLS